MIDWFLEADRMVFHAINAGWTHPCVETWLPYCREKWFWTPIYVYVLAYLSLQRNRRALWIGAGLLLTVLLADTTSSQLIKKNVQRLRPCNDPALQGQLHLRLAHCGSGYSFTSSHATNHFAVATYLIIALGVRRRWLRAALWTWAGLVGLAQVYVGVHYPLDVVVGGLVGLMIGYGVSQYLRPYIGQMPVFRK